MHFGGIEAAQVDDDKVPSADSTDYFDCRNQPGSGSQDIILYCSCDVSTRSLERRSIDWNTVKYCMILYNTEQNIVNMLKFTSNQSIKQSISQSI